MKNYNHLKILIVILTLLFIVYLLLPRRVPHFYPPKSLSIHIKNVPAINGTKPLCSATPNIDEMVNDPFIQQFVVNVSLHCNKTSIYTQVDWRTGQVTLTKDANRDNVSCYYSYFWRMFEEDNYIDYSQVEELSETGVQLTEENDLVNVSCYKQDEKVYLNTHMWIPNLKPEVKMNQRDHDPPNVLVLFLESLSQLTFKKFMPLAEQALNDLGHVQLLKGFVKHEDNSFPNTMSFLTGEKIDRDAKFKDNFFDDVTPPIRYLWDDFREAGYVTGFLEDMSIIGIFNYARRGWRYPPTIWYPRSFWVQMYPESGSFSIWESMTDHDQFCFQGDPKVDLYLDQVLHFIQKMNSNKQPYFLFAIHTQMTHGDINNFKLVDSPYANFFNKLRNKLNNTLLIFAGDHGSRSPYDYVPSGWGRLNERLNLVTIRVPESLNSKYPHLRELLAANRDRLTSWLDVHQLVKDVAINNYDLQEPLTVKSGPVSLWRQLAHPDRTCDDAIINPMYCVCNGTISVDFKQNMLDTNEAEDTVKNYVESLGDEFTNCTRQVVNGTLAMNYIIPDLGQNWMKDLINMTVLLRPSGSQFNVKVNVDHNKGSFKVEDEIKNRKLFQIMC